nr:MAG TPA: hypothetical protein [Microviridae sp.]
MAATNMSGLADTVHDDVKDAAFAYWSSEEARKSQNRSAALQKELNSQMANLARQNREYAALDEVRGLEMAGLSPVLASGGSFSPAGSSGAGPMATASTPNLSHSQMGKLVQEANELKWQQQRFRESEQDLMASEAEKNRAEAEASLAAAGESTSRTSMNEYVMDLWHSRDDSIAASAKRFAESVNNNPNASAMDKAIAAAYADCSNPDAGTLEGIEKFLHNVEQHHESSANVVTNNLREAVASGQLKDEDTLEALRRMPEGQFNQLTASAGDLLSQMYLNQSKKNLTDEDVKKTRQLIVNYAKEADKLDAEVAKLKAERKAIVHGDIIQSMEEDPTATLLREGYTLGKQGVQAYVGAKTLKAGAQQLKPLTTKPQPVNIKLEESWRYNKNGQPTSHKRSQMQGLSD